MKGQITTYDGPRGWGFIENDGVKYFFHVKNSPGFTPVLGMFVEFDLVAPFKLGQKAQAAKLRRWRCPVNELLTQARKMLDDAPDVDDAVPFVKDFLAAGGLNVAQRNQFWTDYNNEVAAEENEVSTATATLEEPVIAALEQKLEEEQAYSDELKKTAMDAVDEKLRLEAEANRLYLENYALKNRMKMPVTEEEVQKQAKLLKYKEAIEERELLPDFESIKTEYPVFPDWVMDGTSFFENHVKPICDANPGARVPHFNFIPGVVLLLNYVGTKVKVALRGWKPSLYVVLIGKRGKLKKSSSINDAVGYFQHIGCATHYNKEMKNAESMSVLFEAGSAEGLGTDMQRVNCKNAILHYDELAALAKKATIESSTLRDTLLKGYESGLLGNSIKAKKDAFMIAPNSYVLSLITASTRKKFVETYMLLGSGNDGLDDRFSFHLQPLVLQPSGPQVYVHTLDSAVATKQLIEKAVNQGTFEIDKDGLQVLKDAMAAGLNDRDEIRAEKYALYFAIDLGRSTIDLDCVQRGLAIARYEVAVKDSLRLVEADSKQAALQIKIRKLLEDAPKGTLTQRDLERRGNASRHGTFNWDNAIGGLLKGGIIRAVTVKGSKLVSREAKGFQVLKLIELDGDED